MNTAKEIRSAFLNYFEERGHRIVPSHSLIPPADPTLLFVNAGMVQFKDCFTGVRDPDYRRAASSQKCLRVSGKHNDLEQVGRTPRHHTFFEMLGNFSFGDYFKREAIFFAWELLTRVYGLKEEDLWITVHPDDAEARSIWISEVGVNPTKIVEDATNIWAMGETGPCGPCSEIHIDRGPAFSGTSLSDPGDRFMELWNLVFMQYDRDETGTLKPLPSPSIDTGMGLERICAVLQGVRSNYETDLFMPLITSAAEIAGTAFGRDEETDTALRVIADHARATAFLISDGVFPSNEGRGYVLRRLMRRAQRFGYKLGLREPFFTRICLTVADAMQGAWPELQENARVIERVALQEEERFLRTLTSGMELLELRIREAKETGRKSLDGTTVFTLYDTSGFPLDLTEMIAAEAGLGVDRDGFERLMEEQRARGRASWKGGDEELKAIATSLMEQNLTSLFMGYEQDETESTITAIFVRGERRVSANPPEEVTILLDITPFYGETGGQVGDTGTIKTDTALIEVVDTKRPHEGVLLHIGKVVYGEVHEGDRCRAVIDVARRSRIRRHHSATHLLHNALRSVLGGHVRQKGSLVTPDRLRFDFSHTGPLSEDELARVEDLANEKVLADIPVSTDVLPFDEAVSRGALHFFEEKYGDVVRLVSMADSKELCGGTHVRRTGEIGLIKIIAENGISAGVRRIEAVTGMSAMAYLREQERVVKELSQCLRVDATSIVERVERLLAEERSLRKQLSELQVKAAASRGTEIQVLEMGGIRVHMASAEGMDAKSARELADMLRDRVGSGIVLLTRHEAGKIAVILAATKDLAATRPANVLLQNVLSSLGGRGGGNALLAQGGIPEQVGPDKLLDALRCTLQS